MKRSSLALASTALFAATLSGAVMAQQATPPDSPSTAAQAPQGMPGFADLDKNGDGNLSRSEIPKNVAALKSLRTYFNQSDLNHSGRLDPAEYRGYVQRQDPQLQKMGNQH